MVHPRHQRQGIGGRLMQTIESMFPEAAKFELFTGNRSEGNIRLYERLGYHSSRSERMSANLSLVFFEKWGRVPTSTSIDRTIRHSWRATPAGCLALR